jgi:NodT family efflux transporter outer membrane factor (OMF) lipoprotein
MNYLKITKITVVIAASLVMQSCFVAKDYQSPNIETEKLFRTEQIKDSVSLATVSWEQLFTDPILQKHIRTGLQNNYDLKIGLQNLAAAEANMKQGKAGYLPTFSANASWTHQELAKNSQFGSFFNGALDQYELSGRLSWEADIWGKIRSNKRAFAASYLQTVAAQQAIQTQLISSISSTYFQLLALDAQIKVAEKTLENRNQSVETIQALKDAGSVNAVAVKQTEAQLYGTQVILEDLKYNVKVLENTLSILLGQAPGTIERGLFENQTMTTDVKVGIPALLLSKRPDVISAEMNFRNAFEMTNVARSNFYPSLTVTANGGFQSLELKDWFSANSLFASVITGLAQPIFNQRQIKTRHEVAKANQEKAYLQFEQTLLTAGKEVSDALASYENETEKLAIRTKQLESLQNAADYSDELLRYGMVNYLEVLTAKDNALNTELSTIDNRFQQLNAVISLYRALGGGY